MYNNIIINIITLIMHDQDQAVCEHGHSEVSLPKATLSMS